MPRLARTSCQISVTKHNSMADNHWFLGKTTCPCIMGLDQVFQSGTFAMHCVSGDPASFPGIWWARGFHFLAANPLGCITLPFGELLELRHKTKLTTRAVPGWMKHLIGDMCDLMPVRLGHGGCDHPISSFQNSHMHIGHSYTQPNPMAEILRSKQKQFFSSLGWLP